MYISFVIVAGKWLDLHVEFHSETSWFTELESAMCIVLLCNFCDCWNGVRMHVYMCKLMFVALVLLILFLLLLSVYNWNLFNVICVVSECMVCMCQGQILHISWVRANGMFVSKLGTDWFKCDTCNALWHSSSVNVKVQTHWNAMLYVLEFWRIVAVVWF